MEFDATWMLLGLPLAFVLPWLTEPPVGVEALGGLVTADGLLSH